MSMAGLSTDTLVLLREKRRRQAAARARAEQEANPVWQPQHRRSCARDEACRCPQVLAYHSPADILGYGGAAGGGKSDLHLGLAGTAHHRSVIFRRVFPSLRAMIERSREIFNAGDASHARDSFNESLHVWRLQDGRMIEFAAVQYYKDAKKQQGQDRDYYGIDEAAEWPEDVIRLIIGWNRTTRPGQRCRVVLTFNPPLDDGGTWIVRFFAPWLDPDHPNPARDGELRYFAMVDGDEVECESGEPFTHNGEVITPKSRTFIHATLADNPILEATGYGATIDAMPEPLRSLLKGNFNAARVANPWQVIPSEWVRLAQERWKQRNDPRVGEGDEPGATPTSIGLDVARGGKDKTVKTELYGDWFAPQTKVPGVLTPDGDSAAAVVVATNGTPNLPRCPVGVDVIGVGSSAYDSLRSYSHQKIVDEDTVRSYGHMNVVAVNFANSSEKTDRSRQIRFKNLRAEAYWKLREALDPKHGDNLALPDDPELRADLCAPTYRITPGGLQIESKEDIIERLGRSPDCGDSLVICHWTASRPRPSQYVAFVEIA